MADGSALLAATGSDLLDQGARQVDGENCFGLRHGPQHQIALCLEKITISLAAGQALELDQGRQDGLGGLLLLQHPDRHIDSLRLDYRRGSGHYDVRLLCYMAYSQQFAFGFACALCSAITLEKPKLSFVYVALQRDKAIGTGVFRSPSRDTVRDKS